MNRAGRAVMAARNPRRRLQRRHRQEVTRTRPDAIRELYRMFAESKRVANEPAAEAAFTSMGLERNRKNIEIVIDYAFRTGMIPRRFSVDELFNGVTATLA